MGQGAASEELPPSFQQVEARHNNFHGMDDATAVQRTVRQHVPQAGGWRLASAVSGCAADAPPD